MPVAIALLAAACGSDRDSDAATTSAAVTTIATTTTVDSEPDAPDSSTETAATGNTTDDTASDDSAADTTDATDDTTDDTTASTETTPATEPASDVEMFGDAPWPCSAGDGANTDDGSTPGVTTDSIHLASGDDAGYAGSPGLNHEMTDAMQAFVAKCNELGGINGRQITLDYWDAALFNVGPAIQGACDSQAFFLVGEGWAFDANQEETRLACGLPAVPSYATSAAFSHGKDTFPPIPNPADEVTTAQYAQMAKLFPEEVKKAVTLVGAFVATQESRDKAVAGASQFGWNFINTSIEYNPTGEADWTPFVKQIQDSGAEIMFWSGACLPNLQLFMQTAQANGLDIPLLTDANHYAQSCADANTDGALNNMYVRINSVPFDEADTTPAVQQYLDLITASDGDTALLGTNAASAFLLWAQAASDCGANLTRECAITNLQNTHEWTGHGLHAATDPGSNHPSSCGAIFNLVDGTYERITPTERGTFECDPAWISQVGDLPAVVAAKLDENRISQQYAPG